MKKFLSLLLILALTLTMFGQVALADGCDMGGSHNWKLDHVVDCETGEGVYFCSKCYLIENRFAAPKPHNYIIRYVPVPGPEVNRHTTPHTPGSASRRLGSGQSTAGAAQKAPAGGISHLRAGGSGFSTCTDPYQKQQYCTVCGKTNVLGNYPPMGHNYGDSWKPVADRPGYEIGTCIRCGGTWTREIEHEHEWGEWYTVTEATSKQNGVEERACGICGVTETREVAPAPAPTPVPGPETYFELTLEETSTPGNGEYYDYDDGEYVRYFAGFTNNSPYDITVVLSDAIGTEFPGSGQTRTCRAGHSIYSDYAHELTPGDIALGELKNRFYADITMPDGEKLRVMSDEVTSKVAAEKWSPTGEEPVPSYVFYFPPEKTYTGNGADSLEEHLYTLTLEITNTPPNVDENGEGYYALGDKIEFTYTMDRGDGKDVIETTDIYDALSDWHIIAGTSGNRYNQWNYLPHVEKKTYTITEDDVKAGFIENRAYADVYLGYSSDGILAGCVYSNIAVARTGGTAPEVRLGLNITNEPKNGRYYTEGEAVEFTYTLTGDDGRYQDHINVYHDLIEKDSVIFSDTHVGSPDLVRRYTVTADDVKKGKVTTSAYALYNSGIHRIKAVDSQRVTFETAPGEPELTLELNRVGFPAIPDGYQEGEGIEYEFVLTAGDDRVYDPVIITDTLTGASLTAAAGGANGGFTGTAHYYVTENDVSAGSVVNRAKAVYTDETGKTYEISSDDCIADILNLPRIPDPFEVGDPEATDGALTVTEKYVNSPANGAFFTEGEEVLLFIEVRNVGDVALKNVFFGDNRMSSYIRYAGLEPGAAKWYEYPYVVTKGDVDQGGFWSTPHARYSMPGRETDDLYFAPPPVDISGDALYVPCNEELPEEKSVSVTKTEVSAYPNGLYYREGEVVEYDLSITNTTGETIYNVEFIDEGVSYVIGTMEPDAYAQVSHFHTVTYIDTALGSFTNQAYVVWGEESGAQDKGAVTNTVTVPCGEDEPERFGSVTVSKSVLTHQDEYHPGDTVMYGILVFNGTDKAILDVDVYDDFTNLSVFSTESIGHADRIEAGEGRPFFYNHIVTGEDVLGGQMGNEAYIIYWPEDSEISNCAVSNYVIVNTAPGEPDEGVEIVATKYELSIPKNGRYYMEGETVTFAVAVANPTGMVFTGVDCYDILLEDSAYYCGSTATLGAEPTVFQIDYVVTDIDAILGNVSNVAWVDAIDPDGVRHSVMSNEVIVPVAEGGHQSGGSGSYCNVYVNAEGEGITSIRTDYCAAHAKLAETAAQFMEEGNTASAKAMWQAALNAAYIDLTTGADEETAALIAREQAAFELKLTSLTAICEARGMDAAAIDNMLIDALRERTCELCADKAVMNKANVKQTETAAITAPVSTKCVIETVPDPMGSTKTISLCMTHRAGDKAVKRLAMAMEESTEDQQETLRAKMLATRESELDAALMKLMTSADTQTKPLIIRYKVIMKSELDLRSRVLAAIRGEAPAADLLLRIYQSETAFLCGM